MRTDAGALMSLDDQHCAFAAGSVALDDAGGDFVWSEPSVASGLTLQQDGRASRIFDVFFAFSLLILVAPVLLLTIIVLQIDTPGPIFFRQYRVGRGLNLFPCFKLRTMVVDAQERLQELLRASPEARAEWARDHKLRNDPRITGVGRFVRRYSLDELPQLVNILLGHMSVVGPRPIVEAEIWRYGDAIRDYAAVRPGLTGLWQVSGRNDTTYEERVELDRSYARNKSLRFDLAILWRTASVVLLARGAY